MMLEEKLFDPSLPKEEQGKGAWERNLNLKTSLGRRSRTDSFLGHEAGKRKLRRTASMKLSSQYDRIWADISGAGSVLQVQKNGIQEPKETESTSQGDEAFHDEREVIVNKSLSLNDTESMNAGVFTGCKFWLHNFPTSKMKILKNHILSNDGEIMHTIDGPTALPSESLSKELLSYKLFLIVPHDLPRSKFPSVPKLSQIEIVTIWWVERCLHHKKFLEPKEHVIGRPFPVFPMHDIKARNMILCSSAFTGIDLLHLTRAVELIGGTYSDFMTPNSTLLIVKSVDSIRKDKVNCALEWKIPIVNANWLWDSIEAGKSLSTAAYEFLPGRRVPIHRRESEGPTNQIKPLEITSMHNQSDSTPKACKKSSKISEQLLPLPDIDHALVNSGGGPKNSETQSTTSSELQKSTELSGFHIKPQVNCKTYSQNSSKDMSNAISSLLAKSKGTLNNQIIERNETRKRSRILGRVTSNTSNQSRATSVDSTATYGQPVQWPSNSSDQTANERIEMLMNGDKARMINTDDHQFSSTQLEYEDPDSLVAREVIMARMRGEFIDIEKIRNPEKKAIMGKHDGSKTPGTRSRKKRGGTNV